MVRSIEGILTPLRSTEIPERVIVRVEGLGQREAAQPTKGSPVMFTRRLFTAGSLLAAPLLMRMYWPRSRPPSILPPGQGTWVPPPVMQSDHRAV
jgi:hypothetical protein